MSADRDVQFTITFGTGDQNRQTVDAANSQLRNLERQASQSSQAAARAVTDNSDAAARSVDEAARRQGDAHARAGEDAARAAARARAEYETASERMQAATNRTLESGRAVADGVLNIAQGVAVLGLSTEAEIEAFAKGYARIQAGIQIVKGGIEVYVKMTEVMSALRVATQASTTAQLALNAAQGAAPGVAAAGAATTMTGAAAVGAAGAGAAGAGGAASAGGASLGSMAGIGLLVVAAGAALYEGVTAAARAIGLVRPETESFVGAIISWRKAVADAAAAEQRTLRQQERFASDFAKRTNDIVGDQGIVGDLKSRIKYDVVNGRAKERDDRTMLYQERDRLQQRQADVRSRLFYVDNNALLKPEEKDQQRAQLEGEIVRLRQESVGLAEREADLAHARVDSLQSEVRSQHEKVRALQEQEKALRKQEAKDQKAQNQSGLAKFGELDRATQQSLIDINQHVATGGQLSRQQAELLRQTGYGQQYLEQYDAERGRKAGGQSVVNVLEGGNTRQMEVVQRQLKADEEIAKAKAREAELSTKLSEAKKFEAEAVGKLTTAINDLIKWLAELRTKQEKQSVNNRTSQEKQGPKPVQIEHQDIEYQLF